jgi:hypothetical protein
LVLIIIIISFSINLLFFLFITSLLKNRNCIIVLLILKWISFLIACTSSQWLCISFLFGSFLLNWHSLWSWHTTWWAGY